MSQVHVVNHPVVAHWLRVLRDKHTPPPTFRQALDIVTHLLLYAATQDLETEPVDVETPLEATQGARLKSRVGFAPILRAGLGMIPAALHLFPQAQVWHLGFYRDETTLQPVEYYDPFRHKACTVDVTYILDPMLATGGSAVAAAHKLKEWGVPKVVFVGLIAAPEGVALLEKHHPDVPIYVAVVDRQLNDQGYILPGLGDAGDRQFGT